MSSGVPFLDETMWRAKRTREPVGASEFGGAPGPDPHAHADTPPSHGATAPVRLAVAATCRSCRQHPFRTSKSMSAGQSRVVDYSMSPPHEGALLGCVGVGALL